MHETLKSLWHGELSPHDRFIKEDSEYHRLSKRQDELIEQLIRELSEDGRKCFEKIDNLNGEMQSIVEEETFITGFQLGARIMLDVMSTYNGQFNT